VRPTEHRRADLRVYVVRHGLSYRVAGASVAMHGLMETFWAEKRRNDLPSHRESHRRSNNACVYEWKAFSYAMSLTIDLGASKHAPIKRNNSNE